MFICTDCNIGIHNHEPGKCPSTWTDSTCECREDYNISEGGLVGVWLTGGKRTNIQPSEWLDDWWTGYGKDESCQFEGPWVALAILAAKILRHPNTQKVAPNLYQPDIPITDEQERHYT